MLAENFPAMPELACYDKLPSGPPRAAAPASASAKPAEDPMIGAAKTATLKVLREPGALRQWRAARAVARPP